MRLLARHAAREAVGGATQLDTSHDQDTHDPHDHGGEGSEPDDSLDRRPPSPPR